MSMKAIKEIETNAVELSHIDNSGGGGNHSKAAISGDALMCFCADVTDVRVFSGPVKGTEVCAAAAGRRRRAQDLLAVPRAHQRGQDQVDRAQDHQAPRAIRLPGEYHNPHLPSPCAFLSSNLRTHRVFSTAKKTFTTFVY